MKKKFLSLLILVFLIVPVFAFVTACGGDDGNKLDKCSIKNWANYSAIAAGTISESQQENSKSLKGDARLLGKRSDGKFEAITFLNSSEKEVTANLYLSGFTAYDNYIFVNFNKEDKGTGIKNFSYGENDFSYIIDYNGNMYSLNGIFSYINLAQKGYCESDTSIYVKGAKTSNGEYCYYRICIEKEKLAVKKVVTVNKYKTEVFFVDRFDNVFLIEKGRVDDINFLEDYEVTLLKKANGDSSVKLSSKADKKADEYSVYKALNGQVYFKPDANGEVYRTFDKEGEFVDELLFVAPTNFYPKDNLIKNNGDIRYYYSQQKNTNGINYTIKLHKMTFSTKTSYAVEDMATKTANDFAVGSEHIFFLNGKNASVLNILSGEEKEVTSDVEFSDIWSDNQGNICYKGTDNAGKEVQGTLNTKGTITKTLPSSDFNIAFVTTK